MRLVLKTQAVISFIERPARQAARPDIIGAQHNTHHNKENIMLAIQGNTVIVDKHTAKLQGYRLEDTVRAPAIIVFVDEEKPQLLPIRQGDTPPIESAHAIWRWRSRSSPTMKSTRFSRNVEIPSVCGGNSG